MPVLDRIAYFQGRRDEVPNQELARDLAESRDQEGIGEIAENLMNENANVQSDCVKVLYEIGFIDPTLISNYAEDFLGLLNSRNNRLVWGSMTALSTIAPLRAELLCDQYDDIVRAIDTESVITRDSGMKVLAAISRYSEACREEAFNYLLRHLSSCRPKDVPRHAESALPAVTTNNSASFVATLERRLPDLSASETQRVQKVTRQAQQAPQDA